MEQAKEPTHADLQQEYNQLCAETGDLQFKIKCHEGELVAKQKRMFELTQTAAKLVQKQKEEAQKPAAASEGATNEVAHQ